MYDRMEVSPVCKTILQIGTRRHENVEGGRAVSAVDGFVFFRRVQHGVVDFHAAVRADLRLVGTFQRHVVWSVLSLEHRNATDIRFGKAGNFFEF